MVPVEGYKDACDEAPALKRRPFRRSSTETEVLKCFHVAAARNYMHTKDKYIILVILLFDKDA